MGSQIIVGFICRKYTRILTVKIQERSHHGSDRESKRVTIRKHTQNLFHSKGQFSKKRCSESDFYWRKSISPLQPSVEILSQLRGKDKTQSTGVRVSKKLTGNTATKEGSRRQESGESYDIRKTLVKITSRQTGPQKERDLIIRLQNAFPPLYHTTISTKSRIIKVDYIWKSCKTRTFPEDDNLGKTEGKKRNKTRTQEKFRTLAPIATTNIIHISTINHISINPHTRRPIYLSS